MPRPPLFTRSFGLLTAAHFLQALGFSSMLLLPLYLEHLEASRTQIGTIMALNSLGGLASRPFVAWSLDNWGRKPTVLVGTAFLVLSMVLLFFVEDLGWLIHLDRILLGIGTGTLFTAYFTWASDMVPEERRTEGLAIFGISGLVPVGLNAFAADAGFAPPDLRLLFAGLGGVIALSALCVLPIQEPDREPDPEPGERRGLGAVVHALSRRPLVSVWLAVAAFAGLVGSFMAFVTVTAADRGVADPANLWLAYAGGAVGVRALGARLPDRLGPTNMVAPALGLYVVAWVLVSSATTGHAFLLAGLLAGLGHGYCFPVLVSLAVSRAPGRWRGTALAVFTAVWSVSELSLPPVLGIVADARSDAFMYVSAALGALLALLAWAVVEHKALPPELEPTAEPPPTPPRSAGSAHQ